MGGNPPSRTDGLVPSARVSMNKHLLCGPDLQAWMKVSTLPSALSTLELSEGWTVLRFTRSSIILIFLLILEGVVSNGYLKIGPILMQNQLLPQRPNGENGGCKSRGELNASSSSDTC